MRVRGPATNTTLVKHEQDRLGIRAAVAAQLGEHFLHLVEVEMRILEVLVKHADVSAVDDGVERAVPRRPLDEAVGVYAATLALVT